MIGVMQTVRARRGDPFTIDERAGIFAEYR